MECKKKKKENKHSLSINDCDSDSIFFSIEILFGINSFFVGSASVSDIRSITSVVLSAAWVNSCLKFFLTGEEFAELDSDWGDEGYKYIRRNKNNRKRISYRDI